MTQTKASFPRFLVGGFVRDQLLGVPSKDVDFAVEAPSFDAMVDGLVGEGFEVFLSSPEYFTARARFPEGTTGEYEKLTADFVLCRKDGAYSDGRRPDSVEPGTLFDDLARRDFTVNAMARAEDGSLVDPFSGQEDLAARVLRCVGSADERIAEDYLRALRAVRFSITKGFGFEPRLLEILATREVAEGLSEVSVERRREELFKAFSFDTVKTFRLLELLGSDFLDACLAGGVKLLPSLKK